jgi:hypothetical protein
MFLTVIVWKGLQDLRRGKWRTWDVFLLVVWHKGSASFPVMWRGAWILLGCFQSLELGELSMMVILSNALVCSCRWLDSERSTLVELRNLVHYLEWLGG